MDNTLVFVIILIALVVVVFLYIQSAKKYRGGEGVQDRFVRRLIQAHGCLKLDSTSGPVDYINLPNNFIMVSHCYFEMLPQASLFNNIAEEFDGDRMSDLYRVIQREIKDETIWDFKLDKYVTRSSDSICVSSGNIPQISKVPNMLFGANEFGKDSVISGWMYTVPVKQVKEYEPVSRALYHKRDPSNLPGLRALEESKRDIRFDHTGIQRYYQDFWKSRGKTPPIITGPEHQLYGAQKLEDGKDLSEIINNLANRYPSKFIILILNACQDREGTKTMREWTVPIQQYISDGMETADLEMFRNNPTRQVIEVPWQDLKGLESAGIESAGSWGAPSSAGSWDEDCELIGKVDPILIPYISGLCREGYDSMEMLQGAEPDEIEDLIITLQIGNNAPAAVALRQINK